MSADGKTEQTQEDSLVQQSLRQSFKDSISEEDLKMLYKKSDIEGIKQTLFTTSSLIISGILLYLSLQNNSYFQPIFTASAMLLHSFFLSFLFMPLHEGIHKSVFETLWMNKALAFVSGFLTWRFPVYYRIYHFPHHIYTGDKTKDPELLDSLLDIKIDNIFVYILYVSGLLFWLDRILLTGRLLLGVVAEPWVKTDENKKDVIFEARYMASIYLAIALYSYFTGSTFAWTYWVLPSLIGQPFLRIYLIAEHNGCLDGKNMIQNTRTLETWWFYRKLAWEMPYHSEHHAFPAVPFHALGKVHSLTNKVSIERSGCLPVGKHGILYFNKELINSFRNEK